jgi:hypothetical protein
MGHARVKEVSQMKTAMVVTDRGPFVVESSVETQVAP